MSDDSDPYGLFFIIKIAGACFLLSLLFSGGMFLTMIVLFIPVLLTPFLMKDKLLNGTGGEKMFALTMISCWLYVVYKMLELKNLI